MIAVKRYHSSLSTNNTSTSSRWERLCKRINTPRKKPHFKHHHYSSLNDDSIQKFDRTGDEMAAKSVQVNGKVRVTNGVDSSHLHCAGNLVERDIRIEDVLDLGEKFNDVLFIQILYGWENFSFLFLVSNFWNNIKFFSIWGSSNFIVHIGWYYCNNFSLFSPQN